LAWQHYFFECTIPCLAEQSGLVQDMPTMLAEDHARQISRFDSQDDTSCYQYHDRDYSVHPYLHFCSGTSIGVDHY